MVCREVVHGRFFILTSVRLEGVYNLAGHSDWPPLLSPRFLMFRYAVSSLDVLIEGD